MIRPVRANMTLRSGLTATLACSALQLVAILSAGWRARMPGDLVPLMALVVGTWLGLTLLGLALGAALHRAARRGLEPIADGLPLGLPLGAATLALLTPVLLDLDLTLEPWSAALLGVALTVGGALVAARSPRLTAVVLVGLVVFDLRGVVGPPPLGSAPERPAGPPLVLVTLDTFRADHLSAIGGFRDDLRTPVLDAIAAEGALFTVGQAPEPLTLPSHTGILTGRFPPEAGVVANGDHVADDAPLVAEELHAAGWRTGAFVASGVLAGYHGLSRGFDHYDDRFGTWHRVADRVPWSAAGPLELPVPRTGQRPGHEVVARALAWLAEEPTRAFLWVHLYDAHSPYRAPQELAEPLDALSDDAPGNRSWVEAWQRWREEHLPSRAAPLLMHGPIRDLRGPVRDYAAEIALVDRTVGELVAALPPDATLVIVADHGEHLGEHGYALNHGRHVFDPSMRVPILIRGSTIAPRTRIDTPTSTVLVGDTLRALADLPRVSDGLLDVIDGSTPPTVRMLSPTQESRFDLGLGPNVFEYAERVGPMKWTVDAKGRTAMVDLSTDPEERDPRPIDDPIRVEAALTTIEAFKTVEEDQAASRSEAERAALRALGYVE